MSSMARTTSTAITITTSGLGAERATRTTSAMPTTISGARVRPQRAEYGFGLVLLLLPATFMFVAAGPTGDWARTVSVLLQGATLIAAITADFPDVLAALVNLAGGRYRGGRVRREASRPGSSWRSPLRQ
jgi:hypothetical protein